MKVMVEDSQWYITANWEVEGSWRMEVDEIAIFELHHV